MSDCKPRPLWPLVTAALFGLPVLYVASFGPAAWILGYATRHGRGNDLAGVVFWIYSPLVWLVDNGPEPIAEAILWYGQLFG